MSLVKELKALNLTAPKEKDTEEIFNEENAGEVTPVVTDCETLPTRPSATLITERKYEGRTVFRKEIFMLEDEEFPDEQFELDPDLYDIQDECQETNTGSVEDTSEENTDEVEAFISDREKRNDGVDKSYNDFACEEERIQKVLENLQDGENFGAYENFDDESIQEKNDNDDHNEDDEREVDDEVDHNISRYVNRIKESSEGSRSKHTNIGNKFRRLEKSVVKKFSGEDVAEDVRKGRCIGHQLKIWDKLLEYRIQFQRVLTLSNQLPPCDLFGTVMKEFFTDPKNRRLYIEGLKKIDKTFKQLAEIQQQLVNMHPDVKKSIEKWNVRGADFDNNNNETSSDTEEISSDIASGYSESDEEQKNQASKSRVTKRLRDEGVSGREFATMGATLHKKHCTDITALRTIEKFYKKFLPFSNDLFSSIFGKHPTSSRCEISANVTKNDIAAFKLFS
ncbi:protein AATF-like [Tropilaelaps mercedesae]|uniref:Protein AATF-like n=1 Tax=Tropilaelaps mercedesae TaxID=418985 RepID=A0A1V9X4Z6_9ACAR|nr:protein AATF-like [Tropilaelaps mercedesae]